MLTINNNNRNNPNFTSTFTFKNPKTHGFQPINQVLHNLRETITGNHVPNGNFRYGSLPGSVYLKNDVRIGYFDQYLRQKANRGFSGGRDIFFYKTERLLKTQHVIGSNPPREEIVHGDTSPYHKVTVSVPDSQDAEIKKLLKGAGIKYSSKTLPDEKDCQYVLINSNNVKKGSLRAMQKFWKHQGFMQMGIVEDFLNTVQQPFRILTARASQGKTYELELRVPNELIPGLRNKLKDFDVKVSDKPKYLNYA